MYNMNESPILPHNPMLTAEFWCEFSLKWSSYFRVALLPL